MQLTPGTRLGPYEIVSVLGTGGMGEVYRATDPRLGRDVAIKVLPEELGRDPERLRRFEQEARAVAALSHPNVLSVHDVGSDGEIHYLVTELLEGRTLRERMEAGPLPVRRATETALEIARGLAAAHAAGIVHRDLKPDNVFVSTDGRVSILDFGLARATGAGIPEDAETATSPLTSPGSVMGTVGYMAPEQVRGEPADHRSDIFAFGVVLYEMLSGLQPFRRDTSAETMTAILREEPPPLEDSGTVPPALARIVERCLEKVPERRFQSASDLAFAIGALSGSGISATAHGAPPERRPRRWLPLGVGVLAIAAALAAIAWPRPDEAPDGDGTIRFEQITFGRGYVRSARFGPDDRTIVYGGTWDGRPMRVFTGRADTLSASPVGPEGSDLLAVSSSAELAVALDRNFGAVWVPFGTLATIPLLGGAPRPVLPAVTDADWSRDGRELAVSRFGDDGGHRLEYPIGTVLYETNGFVGDLRVSPDGELVAFVDHAIFNDDMGTIAIVDRQGEVTRLTERWVTAQGLAWSPSGDEVWFTAGGVGDDGAHSSIRAVDLGGDVRMIRRGFPRLKLHDIRDDGAVLVTTERITSDIRAGSLDGEIGPSLAAYQWATITDLSEDGRSVLITEFNASGAIDYSIFLRDVDGGEPIRLGEGAGGGITPDGRTVVAIDVTGDQSFRTVPVGTGAERHIETGDIESAGWAMIVVDEERMILHGSVGDGGVRPWLVDITGDAPPKSIVDEDGIFVAAVSPDRRSVLARAPGGRTWIVPLDGGDRRALTHLQPDDGVAAWMEDGDHLLVYRAGGLTARVERLDMTTGEREPWIELAPADPAAALAIRNVLFTRDGQRFAYEVRKVFSDLFVVHGLE